MVVKDLLTLEYEHLKEEQRLRIGTRDNLIYATLGSLALVGAGALQTGTMSLLLLVSPVCLVLGWTYLVNDDRITAIGRHIETAIIPALIQLVPADSPVLGWERAHRTDRYRRRRKLWQTGVDLLTFVGAPVAALSIVVVEGGPLPVALVVVAGVELLATVLLAAQIIGQAVRP